MENAAFVAWVALRITRWISWVSFLVYSLPSLSQLTDQATLITSAGLCIPLKRGCFGLPMLAVTLGLFELMMREQAGIARPDYFHLMPPVPPFELTGTVHCPSRCTSHSGGRGTNRSGGRDRRDGPTHDRGRL